MYGCEWIKCLKNCKEKIQLDSFFSFVFQQNGVDSEKKTRLANKIPISWEFIKIQLKFSSLHTQLSILQIISIII